LHLVVVVFITIWLLHLTGVGVAVSCTREKRKSEGGEDRAVLVCTGAGVKLSVCSSIHAIHGHHGWNGMAQCP
jgi:hypothetical protein